MSGFYYGKSVAVCGGGGFLGSHVVEELLQAGAKVRVIQRSVPTDRLASYLDNVEFVSADLTSPDNCRSALAGMEIVFNAAAHVGGIQYNLEHPALLFQSNSTLGLNLLEAARLEGAERFILTSSTCVYSREAPVPTPEEYGLFDEPEPSNIGYGWAKRMEELAARFYHSEYETKVAVARLTNLYGPKDNFDPAISHVIPALIKRTMEADGQLTVWGSGTQTRSFLFVRDAAQALLAIGEHYPTADPLNVGTDEEVTIRQLVAMIIEATGLPVEPIFDASGPEGQPRKAADISKAKRTLDWRPSYALKNGLQEAVQWYASLRASDPDEESN